MKEKLILATVVLLAALTLTQAALASTCSFTFESGGVTYCITHHVDNEGSWFKTENPMQDTSPHFNDYMDKDHGIIPAAQSDLHGSDAHERYAF